MANHYPRLNAELADFTERRNLLIVATSGRDGRVKLSPRGMETLRIRDDTCAVWLNLTGSNNEPADPASVRSGRSPAYTRYRLALLGHYPPHAGVRQKYRITPQTFIA